jgi:hypothetical protein
MISKQTAKSGILKAVHDAAGDLHDTKSVRAKMGLG